MLKSQNAHEAINIRKSPSLPTKKTQENVPLEPYSHDRELIGITLELRGTTSIEDTHNDFIDLEAMLQNPRKLEIERNVHWAPIVEAPSSNDPFRPNRAQSNGKSVGNNNFCSIWRRNTETHPLDYGLREEEQYEIIFKASDDQQEDNNDYPLQIEFSPSEDLDSIYNEESPTAAAPENMFEKPWKIQGGDCNAKRRTSNYWKLFTVLLLLSFISGHASKILIRCNIAAAVFEIFWYCNMKAKTYFLEGSKEKIALPISREEIFLQSQIFPVLQRGLESTHSLRSKASNFVTPDETFLQFRLNEVGAWLR